MKLAKDQNGTKCQVCRKEEATCTVGGERCCPCCGADKEISRIEAMKAEDNNRQFEVIL